MPLIRRSLTAPERRNPCTHMTMTRLYDPTLIFKCSLCHKQPNIGWLYRCTQDTGGFIPESDFTDKPPVRGSRPFSLDVTTHSLSSSIIQAIGEGQYTDEQVKRLIEQKQAVKDLVVSQQQQGDFRPPTSSTYSTASSSSSDGGGTLSTLPQNTCCFTRRNTVLLNDLSTCLQICRASLAFVFL